MVFEDDHEIVTFSVVWLNEDYELLFTLTKYLKYGNVFIDLSFITLMVMNLDWYFAMAHPIFHRTAVTKSRLLALLTILVSFYTILYVISVDDLVVQYHVCIIIFLSIVSPPILFINYKLFKICRRMRRENAVSPDGKRILELRNISTCLLAVACFVLLSIPGIVYIAFLFTAEESTSITLRLSWLWVCTITALSSTFNCLIFFWKNPVLRIEGMKIFTSLKGRRHLAS